jgi:hypothetical protein
VARWTSAVAFATVASGTGTNAVIPWRLGYARYTVYAISAGSLLRLGDVESWR